MTQESVQNWQANSSPNNNSKEVGEWRNKNEWWEDTKQEANAMERGG